MSSLCCLSGQQTPPHDMVLVYILFGFLFGAVRHLSWHWFIHTTKPEQQASKRMLWLPCKKHPCRTFAFLLSTEKSMKYNKTSEPLSEIQNTDSFNPRRKMKALQHSLCWPWLFVCQCCFSVLGPSVTFFAYHSVLGSPEAVFGFSVHSSGPESIMWVTSQRPLEGQQEWEKQTEQKQV